MLLDHRRWVWAAFATAALSGCAQPAAIEADQALACFAPSDQIGAEMSHGFSAPVPISAQGSRPVNGTRVVYLNRHPRTYVSGVDDALTGSSSVLSAQSVAMASVPGFQQGDEAWNDVLACIRTQYAAFDVAITDVRPVTPGYVEAHFGGSGPEIGIHDGSGGIAPIDSVSCGIVDSAVVYVFTDLFGHNTRSICEVGAHEIAHVYSLDHEFQCKDPMTYVEGCGDKDFQSDDEPCGESGPRACICKRTSQNSVAILRAQLGDQKSDLVPPIVQLLDPVPAPSGEGTYVQVRAHDPNAALAAVELHIERDGVEQVAICGDDTLPCTLDGELASFAVPQMATDARVWAVAQDTGGNRTSSLEIVVHAGAQADPNGVALAVAPLAMAYAPGAVVEVQALVLAQQAITSAVAVWQDGDGTTHEIPLCPGAIAGRYGISVHLGGGDATRSFYVRATDALGHTVRSTEVEVSVSTAAAL